MVALFLIAEMVEWFAADTPLFPQRAVAALSLALVLPWAVYLHRHPRPAPWVDATLVLLTFGAGWGLGRHGAVIALLVGVLQYRALYGERRSVVVATTGVLAAHVLLIGLLEGRETVLSLGTLVVVVAAAALAPVLRLVGEALAAHDLATAWDAILTDAAEDLMVATTPTQVDDVVERALALIRRTSAEATGGLWRAPVDLGALPGEARTLEEHPPGPARPRVADLDAVLRRLAGVATLARDRIDSQERFRILAQNSREGIYVLQLLPTVGFRYVNPAAERLLGRPAPAIYRDAREALARVHPRDRAAAGIAQEHRVVEEPARIRLVRGEDDVVWVELQEVVLEWQDDAPSLIQGVMRDVTSQWAEAVSLRRALEQEAAAATELRAVDEMKSTFLRAVSHELRTPLTAVVGSAVTLRRLHGQLSPTHVEQLLDAIHRQSARLERLLEDLLDVDRLSRGMLHPDRHPTELRSLVRRVIAATPHEDHEVTVAGEPMHLLLDAPKIERLVDNLLRNAYRHTPPGTHVLVGLERCADGVRLYVEDDGPGLPPGASAELFEPFVQGPDAHRAASPGTGIGLALVGKLAELHGGRAWAEPSREGGARFVVSLRAAPASPATRGEPAPGPVVSAATPSPSSPDGGPRPGAAGEAVTHG